MDSKIYFEMSLFVVEAIQKKFPNGLRGIRTCDHSIASQAL